MDDEQKIVQLTPLADALAALDAVAKPVRPSDIAAGEAAGFVLATDVTAPAQPAGATALQDGWAVRADELTDAGGYAPVRLATPPARVETGDAMPAGSDAVASPDIIVMREGFAEAVGAVTAGEGVSLPGSESDRSTPLRKGGQRVGAVHAAAFEAAGIAQVSVRVPHLLFALAREDLRLRPALQLIARDCGARGGEPLLRNGGDLSVALHTDNCDAIVIIGGSGGGRRDRSVQTLGQIGRVSIHGIGLTPGETAALGHVGPRPVLIVPGRLDAALAVWLTLGRCLLARLAGDDEPELAATRTLSRKVTSTVGLAELVPVRHDQTNAEPLAIKYLPLRALARANGWLLVPPDSEGFPAGAKVAIYNWP